MSTISDYLGSFQFNRTRTIGLLDKITARPDCASALAWRPSAGRAPIAWQLMHIGVTEDIFASLRLAPHKRGLFETLWPRFRGGSTPDDDTPTPEQIRDVLTQTRSALVQTLGEYDDSRLAEIPPSLAERKLTVHDVLRLIGWHEAHHQGQAHITFNLYQAAHPA